MKIAFVTPGYDPRDMRRGSGTFYYMAQELERQGCELHYVGPIVIKDPLPTRFFRLLTRWIWKGKYLTYLDPWVASARSKVVASRLAGIDIDLILTNDHGISAGNLMHKPVVIFTDVMIPFSRNDGFNRPFASLNHI